jgi:hypothetical protein
MADETSSKPIYKKWWFIALSLVAVLWLLGSIGNDSPRSPDVTEGDPNTTAAEPTQKDYVEVMSFSGNGQKTSEPFTITGSRFKIAYDCAGNTVAAYCGAYVFKVGSKLPQVVMNSAQPVNDETIVYGSGDFYLDANVIGSFTMTVYDYK